ncbi:hypothetical protein [Streptomyces sp. NPDC018833]
MGDLFPSNDAQGATPAAEPSEARELVELLLEAVDDRLAEPHDDQEA